MDGGYENALNQGMVFANGPGEDSALASFCRRSRAGRPPGGQPRSLLMVSLSAILLLWHVAVTETFHGSLIPLVRVTANDTEIE
jgi:hypothetical protein